MILLHHLYYGMDCVTFSLRRMRSLKTMLKAELVQEAGMLNISQKKNL